MLQQCSLNWFLPPTLNLYHTHWTSTTLIEPLPHSLNFYSPFHSSACLSKNYRLTPFYISDSWIKTFSNIFVSRDLFIQLSTSLKLGTYSKLIYSKSFPREMKITSNKYNFSPRSHSLQSYSYCRFICM